MLEVTHLVCVHYNFEFINTYNSRLESILRDIAKSNNTVFKQG